MVKRTKMTVAFYGHCKSSILQQITTCACSSKIMFYIFMVSISQLSSWTTSKWENSGHFHHQASDMHLTQWKVEYGARSDICRGWQRQQGDTFSCNVIISMAYLHNQGHVYCALIEADIVPFNAHSLACLLNWICCSFGCTNPLRNSQSTPTARIILYSIPESSKGDILGVI